MKTIVQYLCSQVRTDSEAGEVITQVFDAIWSYPAFGRTGHGRLESLNEQSLKLITGAASSIMVAKHCVWGMCNADSRYPERYPGVQFIPFVKPKREREKCIRWIKACGRPHSQLSVQKINKWMYICSRVCTSISCVMFKGYHTGLCAKSTRCTSGISCYMTNFLKCVCVHAVRYQYIYWHKFDYIDIYMYTRAPLYAPWHKCTIVLHDKVGNIMVAVPFDIWKESLFNINFRFRIRILTGGSRHKVTWFPELGPQLPHFSHGSTKINKHFQRDNSTHDAVCFYMLKYVCLYINNTHTFIEMVLHMMKYVNVCL